MHLVLSEYFFRDEKGEFNEFRGEKLPVKYDEIFQLSATAEKIVLNSTYSLQSHFFILFYHIFSYP